MIQELLREAGHQDIALGTVSVSTGRDRCIPERRRPVNLRISIRHSDPKQLIAVLKKFTDQVVKDRALPPMQLLSSDEPYVLGDAIAWTPKPVIKKEY